MSEEIKNKSIDQASIEMLEKAARENIRTVFSRAEKMKPCPIGGEGSCCSIRITGSVIAISLPNNAARKAKTETTYLPLMNRKNESM